MVAHDDRRAAVEPLGRHLDRLPGLGVLHGVVEQVEDGAHHLAPIALDPQVRGHVRRIDRDARGLGRPPHLVDGIADERRDRERLAPRALLRLDDAEVEEILDDARQPLALAHHALGEPSGHLGLAPRRDRLGQHRQGTDRRAQLVTDIGDEVAAHALDLARLGDITHERDGSARRSLARERKGAQLQRLLRWAEEDELSLRGLSEQRLVEQLADRLRGDGIGVACATEAARGRVAHEHPAVAPDHYHSVGHRVQCRFEPIAVDAQVLRVRPEIGDRLVDLLGRRRIRVVVARFAQRPDAPLEPSRAHEHDDEKHDRADEQRERQGRHPNRPVM